MKTHKIIFLHCFCMLAYLPFFAQGQIEAEDCEADCRQSIAISPISAMPPIQHTKGTDIYTLSSPLIAQNIECEKGTTVVIPDSAFVDEKGKLITQPVKIEMKECYSLSDMVLAHLSTQTPQGILETGGMFYIHASTEDGKNVLLAKNKCLSINVPNENPQNGMTVFYTTPSENANMMWQESEIPNRYWAHDAFGSKREVKTYSYSPFVFKYDILPRGNKKVIRAELVSADARFSPNMQKMMKRFFYNPNYLTEGKFVRKSFKVLLSQKELKELKKSLAGVKPLERGSKVEDFRFEKSISTEVVLNPYYWAEHHKKVMPLTYHYWHTWRTDLFPTKCHKDSVESMEKYIKKAGFWIEENQKKMNQYLLTMLRNEGINPTFRHIDSLWFKQSPQGRVKKLDNQYAMSITNLGWINIDKLLKVPTKPLYVNLSEVPKNLQVNIVLQNYNAILQGEYTTKSMARFAAVPLAEPARLFAYALQDDGNVLWSYQELTIGEEKPEKMTFTKLSQAEFLEKMRALDGDKAAKQL